MLQNKVSRVYRPARKILRRDGSSFLNQSFSRCSRRDILNYLSFNLVWYSPRRPAQHWSTGFWKHKKDREHRFNHDSPCSLSSLTPPWRNGKRHRRHVGTSSGNPYKPCNFLKALQTHKIQVWVLSGQCKSIMFAIKRMRWISADKSTISVHGNLLLKWEFSIVLLQGSEQPFVIKCW